MAHRNLREFLIHIESIGELRTVKGAHPHTEIGCITELMGEHGGPALLFDEIHGFPAGQRIASNVFYSVNRTALALGLSAGMSGTDVVKGWREKLHSLKPLQDSVQMGDGPILENIVRGADVNLHALPAVKWHELDGGNYIGTGTVAVTRDPDDRSLSLSTYRLKVEDHQTTTIHASPGGSGRRIMEKYWARGLACPIAISLGQEPSLFFASFYRGAKVSDVEFAAGLKGEPIQCVKGLETGLPVPAEAEIVLEGEVLSPKEMTRSEGPWGEFMGYYHEPHPELVFRVKAILHRNDPINLGAPPLKPPLNYFPIPLHSAVSLWDELEDAGIEGIQSVWAPLGGGALVSVVSIRQQDAGHAMRAGSLAARNASSRFIILVDEDIDPSNLEEVIWALGTRCDPEDSLEVLAQVKTLGMDPRVHPDRRRAHKLTTGKCVLNACKPYEWRDRFPITSRYSRDSRQALMTKWRDLFPAPIR